LASARPSVNRANNPEGLRGIDKVRGEWALVCSAYNIRKLHIPDPA